MLDKKEYLQMKRDIKCLCRKNLIKLCDDMELNETERTMLIDFYDGQMIQYTCMNLCITAPTYNKYMRTLFCKIKDYKNTL